MHAIKNSVLYLGKIFADCEFVCLFVYYYIFTIMVFSKQTNTTNMFVSLAAGNPPHIEKLLPRKKIIANQPNRQLTTDTYFLEMRTLIIALLFDTFLKDIFPFL